MGPDQGTYSYVAERILDGGLPYVDAYDNKPPGTYYAHAAVLWLVPSSVRWSQSCLPAELFQPCGYVALQAADIVWTAATLVALFAVARRVTGAQTGALVAVTLAALFLNLSQLSKEGSTPEKQLLLPMVLAYLAVARWHAGGRIGWLGLAGVAAGVAFVFKQTAISVPLALVLWAAWEQTLLKRRTPRHRRPWMTRAMLSGATVFLASFVAPLALVSASLAQRNAVGPFWDAAFAYNVGQAGSDVADLSRAFARGAWQVFSGSSALLWLLALGGALAAARGAWPLQRLAVTWAAADTLSLFLGGTKFAQVHFVQLVPAYAILAALAVGAAWRATRGALRVRVYAIAALVAVGALSNPLQLAVSRRAWNERLPWRAVPAPEERIARRLIQEMETVAGSSATRTLYVLGDASQVYVLAGARSPSRFFHGFPTSQVYTRGTGWVARRAELVYALQENPPFAVVIDPATRGYDPDGRLGFSLAGFPELAALLRADYRLMADGSIPSGWAAYIRQPTTVTFRTDV